MVKVDVSVNRTAEAVYKSYQEDAEDWRRPHLGASLIGKTCHRALWYSFRWADNPSHEGRILRLFETGDMEEDRVIRNLRRIGMEVFDRNEATGEQWRVSFVDGHFGGSSDGVVRGVLEAPKTWHLLEVKTANEKQFAILRRDGVKAAKPEHYAQMQVYMHGLKLERAFYVCVCKNTDDIYTERIHYDKAHAEVQVAKAKSIISAMEPLGRISEDPTWFECRFCNHQDVCQLEHVEKLERNCRTCLSSTPGEGVTWTCDLFCSVRNVEEQRAGCPKHLFIPKLLPWPAIEADSQARRVVYERPDKVRVVDHAMQLSVEMPK